MDTQTLAQLAFEAALKGGLSWQNLVAVGFLVGLVALARLVLAPRVPFFTTSEGGVLLNVVVSGLVGAVTALVAHVPFTWALLGTSLVMSWKAAGGWSLLKNLWPLVSPFLAKIFPPKADGLALVSAAQAVPAAPVKTPSPEDVANGG